MSKGKRTVPKFRFPEFEHEGEWRKKRFEELFEIGNGRDYKHLDNGEVPVYGSGGYMLSVDDYLYDGESVCIGRKGTIDKPMFLTGKFWTVDTLFYTHSFKDCLPKYIHYVFQNIDWLKHNEAGGVPSLSKTNVYKIETLVPKPKEQQKIAACLSSLDELIAAHTDKLQTLKDHKKGLMQNLFPQEGETVPKYRFPEFEGDGEWEWPKLEDKMDVFRGASPRPQGDPRYYGGSIPRLMIQDVTRDGKYSTPKIDFLTEAGAAKSRPLKKGSVVLSCSGTRVAIPGILAVDACIHDGWLGFKNFRDVDAQFLYYHFCNFHDRIQGDALAGGVFNNLTTTILKEMKLGFPTLKEQQKVSSFLSAVDELITAQSDKIEQLQQHKKGLMQGLFPNVVE
jgi:type I restriction enzyme, S subunit